MSLAIFISCKDVETPPELFGEWKLIETCHSDGASQCQWKTVSENNSHKYIFNKDGTTTQDLYFPNCSGTYSMTSEDVIRIDFPCIDLDLCFSIVELSNKELIFGCLPKCSDADEGCSYKYKRIN